MTTTDRQISALHLLRDTQTHNALTIETFALLAESTVQEAQQLLNKLLLHGFICPVSEADSRYYIRESGILFLQMCTRGAGSMQDEKPLRILEEPIRALSWKEPYCSLMLHNKIETRTWQTNFRGLVLMCATKEPYTNEQLLRISGEAQYVRIKALLDNPLLINGNAIAIGRLIDCRPMKKEDEDACFVKFNWGLYCHVYERVAAIEPLPWRGAQGWMQVAHEKRKLLVLK